MLDRYAAPRPYALPEGKRPDQIRSIAFARDGRTHTWYDDGTHSLGTPARLGTPTMRGEQVARVETPSGRPIREIVGIAIDKASDTGDAEVSLAALALQLALLVPATAVPQDFDRWTSR